MRREDLDLRRSPARTSRRVLNVVGLLACENAIVLASLGWAPTWAIVAATLALSTGFVATAIRPCARTAPTPKTRALDAGCELVWLAVCGIAAETLIYLALYVPLRSHIAAGALIANAVVSVCLAGVLALVGFIRIVMGSRRARLGRGLLVFCLWWVPIAGLVLLARFRHVALTELAFVTAGIERDARRRDARVCQTRYPILLVHGIFFRDWERFNYWGRIPDALQRNGASVHYGRQQSSSSVEHSAAELASAILALCDETGAEKVNIIAHSKGGLDSRYAISRFGLGDRVASLTTINTPHLGTVLAESLIARTPDHVVLAAGKRYDALFAKLGDDQPDFLAGVLELTPAACAALNAQMPDDPRVLYQSCGSVMRSARSAPFPLSLGYQIIRLRAGDNDGLVDVRSMAWGQFVALARGTGKTGVSHGDMIDLLRQDIPGFDVCEFYVQLVAGLRQRGL